ncbi:MAG TPA: hypothetical protein VFA77_14755, partial [Candidatus Eisenbacteria bacterium]|nr:hypothetical protein [Candidatus Eisenbacteria bacterium]
SALAALAKKILERPANKNPRALAEADFYGRYAVQLASENPEVARIHTEFQRQIKSKDFPK